MDKFKINKIKKQSFKNIILFHFWLCFKFQKTNTPNMSNIVRVMEQISLKNPPPL